MSDEKVALKKIVQICTNFNVLSMYVILFSISAGILINASFFLHNIFQPKALFDQWTNQRSSEGFSKAL